MGRFYANENFPLPVAEELRALGHDVLTVRETGKAGASWPDGEVLNFAVAERRAVLTFNRRHFVRLHAERPGHAGIVACSVDPNFTALAQRIHSMVLSHPDLAGRLLRVNRPVG